MKVKAHPRTVAWLAAVASIVAMLTAAPASAQPPDQAPARTEPHQHLADATPLPLFPLRESSGTAWVPDETPMCGAMPTLGGWQAMLERQPLRAVRL